MKNDCIIGQIFTQRKIQQKFKEEPNPGKKRTSLQHHYLKSIKFILKQIEIKFYIKLINDFFYANNLFIIKPINEYQGFEKAYIQQNLIFYNLKFWNMLIIISNFPLFFLIIALSLHFVQGQSSNNVDLETRTNESRPSLRSNSVSYNIVSPNKITKENDKILQKKNPDDGKQNLQISSKSNPPINIFSINIPQQSISQPMGLKQTTIQVDQKQLLEKDQTKNNNNSNISKQIKNSQSLSRLSSENFKQISPLPDLKISSNLIPKSINDYDSSSSSYQMARRIVSTFRNDIPQANLAQISKQTQNQRNNFSPPKQESSNFLPFQRIFSKFIKHEQIPSMVLTADYLPMTKIIKQVIQSSMTCQQRVSYLSDYLGRIQTAIQFKNNQNNQMKQSYSKNQQQIGLYNQEIYTYIAKINDLQIVSLLDRYLSSAKQLLLFYKIKNNAAREQQQRKTQLSTIQSIKDELINKALQTYQQMTVYKVKLNQVNQNEKQQIFSNITKLEQLLKSYDEQIGDIRKQVSNIENQRIQRVSKDTDVRILNLRQLEDKAGSLRAQVNKNMALYRQYNQKIMSINQKIYAQQNKNSLQNYDQNEFIIRNLLKILPDIRQKVDEQNFLCNRIKTLDLTILINQTTYITTPSQFVSYIKSSYNITTDMYSFPAIRVKVNSYTIQDKIWKDNFGIAYNQAAISNADNLYYDEDFQCLSPESLSTGTGKIISRNKKSITIFSNNLSIKLNLGACTRIQSLDELPRPGQNIYFRGVRISQIEYNIYRATCY